MHKSTSTRRGSTLQWGMHLLKTGVLEPNTTLYCARVQFSLLWWAVSFSRASRPYGGYRIARSRICIVTAHASRLQPSKLPFCTSRPTEARQICCICNSRQMQTRAPSMTLGISSRIHACKWRKSCDYSLSSSLLIFCNSGMALCSPWSTTH